MALLLATLLGAGWAAPASAQQGAVGGVVVAAESQQPVVGAQVSVEGTRRGTLTGADGRFRIDGLTGQQVTVRVTMIGYSTATQTVAVGRQDLRFELTQTALELDAMVVTGTPGETQRRALGNAVAQVNAAEIAEKAPVTTVSELLNGRAPGVVLQQQQGTAGGGARIMIRGRGSMAFVGDPLIYVDGIRVNNDLATGPSTPEANAPTVLSRLDDIDPNDIESIEIIKGPAAATLYGTEASAGVIQIITKRGQSGDARFGVQVRQGTNFLPNEREKVGLRWGLDASGQPYQFSVVDAMDAQGLDYFRTGHIQGYDVNVSGGADRMQYYLSANYDREEGIVPSNLASKFRGRANLAFQPRENLDVRADMGLTTGRVDTYHYLYYFVGKYAIPALKDTPTMGFLELPPWVQLETQEIFQDLNHVTGSVQLNHRPATWFAHRLTTGLDLTNEENVWTIPFVPDRYGQFYPPAQRSGQKSIDEVATELTTFDYSATATLPVSESLQSKTSGGVQYYRKLVKVNELSGRDFPAPGVTSIDGITGIKDAGEDLIENSTVGVFIQQEMAWKDRLFLTAAIRADDNSAFGADFDLVTYPKISASWVISEEPFWGLDVFDALKLRAAYGESGQQPDAFAALRTYRPVAGSNDLPAGSPRFLGNPELGPERGREVETGFEGSLLEGRLGVDFTYYYRRTEDAIVSREVAPSTGFPGTQFVNAGSLESKGIELLLTGRPLDTRNVDLDLSFNYSQNSSKVLSIDLPGVDQIPVSWIPNYHREGYAPGSFFGKQIVSAEKDAQGNPINVLCDNGAGGSVACADAPSVFLGQNFPDKEGSFSSTLTLFDQVELYGLLDFKLGRSYLNADKLYHCAIFGTHEINFYPERYSAADVAGCGQAGGIGLFDGWTMASGDFAKLRELSLRYRLPEALTARFRARGASLSIAARNLYTWRKDDPFDNSDPEPFTTGNYGGAVHNQSIVPLPTTLVTTINVTF